MAKGSPGITAQVKALKVGESVSRTRRIPLAELVEEEIKQQLSTMRNGMNQVAGRMKEELGRDYRVESGSFITYDGQAVILTVVISRMEDPEEDDI